MCGIINTILKSNGPNLISKDVLRDEGCPIAQSKQTWTMWDKTLSLILFLKMREIKLKKWANANLWPKKKKELIWQHDIKFYHHNPH